MPKSKRVPSARCEFMPAGDLRKFKKPRKGDGILWGLKDSTEWATENGFDRCVYDPELKAMMYVEGTDKGEWVEAEMKKGRWTSSSRS
eukprot:7372796-Prymnesium_polylepis.1